MNNLKWFCISNNGNEFLGKEFQETLQSYGVKSVSTTDKNPQANLKERVHQTLGNILCSYKLEDHDFDYQDPWSQILANCGWAICSTVHSVLNGIPAQIVFGRGMLFDSSFTTEYKDIKKTQTRGLRCQHTQRKLKKSKAWISSKWSSITWQRFTSMQTKPKKRWTVPDSVSLF